MFGEVAIAEEIRQKARRLLDVYYLEDIIARSVENEEDFLVELIDRGILNVDNLELID